MGGPLGDALSAIGLEFDNHAGDIHSTVSVCFLINANYPALR
ncbi:hypothetical protein GP5015_1033 [gamma proteobacterium HTCC5015]|nr:hypothetical protein GP5015_1033 [gamma proteobacterium HTCC5015]